MGQGVVHRENNNENMNERVHLRVGCGWNKGKGLPLNEIASELTTTERLVEVHVYKAGEKLNWRFQCIK